MAAPERWPSFEQPGREVVLQLRKAESGWREERVTARVGTAVMVSGLVLEAARFVIEDDYDCGCETLSECSCSQEEGCSLGYFFVRQATPDDGDGDVGRTAAAGDAAPGTLLEFGAHESTDARPVLTGHVADYRGSSLVFGRVIAVHVEDGGNRPKDSLELKVFTPGVGPKSAGKR